MKWTGVNEIRSSFLNFFESKGHTVLESAPLVPQDDNSLLLINSGMAPLKKYFTGAAKIEGNKATSCQKCIRTPDIDNVGKTARHGTYFEMLGNFSFGDYFKKEAIAWAWEFLTKEMAIPKEKLWVSVYLDDDDAASIWENQEGVPANRIVRLGKEDNFWEIGTGPCGPCSEIHYDRGEQYGCGKDSCTVGCDCDRYMEIWNLVFTQFNSDGEGNYTPLDYPNIDTGMGLERIACIMQDVGNLFEIDTMSDIMAEISKRSGIKYKTNPDSDISIRVVTDHIRSTTFMINDGVRPENEGRGYVLKRLLRRAARHGRLLGINEPFLFELCETVISQNKEAYPRLVDNKDYIVKVIKSEEERFAKTIDQGMDLLSNIIEDMEGVEEGKRILSGELAFKLYDTFGFPIDLTREMLAEKNISINEEMFDQMMRAQKERARAARAAIGEVSWEGDIFSDFPNTEFLGYEKTDSEAKILAIVRDGELVDSLNVGDKAAVLLDKTPFYAEGGGQVGDSGILADNDTIFAVIECKKTAGGKYLHMGKLQSGTMAVGESIKTAVGVVRHNHIERNHTACHLLQYALRQVLGTHVNQAGSYVDESVCRFDFSHFSAVTAEELKKVEKIVNDMILSAHPAVASVMTMDQAREEGAIALFSEKYGDTVRVLNIGGLSVELCGGTHVSNTANIGMFKIIKESSVAAGVRRIEAVTGEGVLEYLNNIEYQLNSIAATLKLSSTNDVVEKVTALAQDNKEKDREIADLKGKMAGSQVDDIFKDAKEVAGIKLVSASFTGMDVPTLRGMGDKLRDKRSDVVAILSSIVDNKGSILVVCGKDAVAKGVHAGKFVKEICSLTGGSGGGKPDSAMGGAGDIFKIDEAVAKGFDILSAQLGE